MDRPDRAELFQLPQGFDLWRLQRDPAQHHHQGGARVVIEAGFDRAFPLEGCWRRTQRASVGAGQAASRLSMETPKTRNGMSSMRQLTYVSPGKVEWREVPLPTLQS